MKILIVDDEPLILSLLEDYIEGINSTFKIYTLSDPVGAIDLIKNEGIHFVISDFKMPNIDGLKLLKLLDSLQNPPAFCMISGDIPREFYKVKHRNAMYAVQKPFKFDDIDKIISNMYSKLIS